MKTEEDKVAALETKSKREWKTFKIDNFVRMMEFMVVICRRKAMTDMERGDFNMLNAEYREAQRLHQLGTGELPK